MSLETKRIWVLLCVFSMAFVTASGKDMGRRDARMWEVLEWRVETEDYSGNPCGGSRCRTIRAIRSMLSAK